MSSPSSEKSFLATRRGKLTLLLLCAVAFLDFVDAPIVNVALPSIRHALHFSVASLRGCRGRHTHPPPPPCDRESREPHGALLLETAGCQVAQMRGWV